MTRKLTTTRAGTLAIVALAGVLFAALATAAFATSRQGTAYRGGYRDFHGSVAWTHRATHTFGLHTRGYRMMRFTATGRTRYDSMGSFNGCRAGRQLTVHAQRVGGRWMAVEIRRETGHGSRWHDGSRDSWGYGTSYGSNHGNRGWGCDCDWGYGH